MYFHRNECTVYTAQIDMLVFNTGKGNGTFGEKFTEKNGDVQQNGVSFLYDETPFDIKYKLNIWNI